MTPSENRKLRRKENKEYVQTLKLKTGCKVCGYNKCAEALEFDHRDPITKEGKYETVSISTRAPHSIDKINKIITKCDLLCANCHREKSVRNQDYK